MQHQGSPDAPRSLSEELADLQNLDVRSLKQRWRRLYGTEPPAKISRSLLLLAVAYRLQEQTLGGLQSSTRRLLERVAQERDTRPSKPALNRVSPGTVLMREWHGVTHRVTVLEDGALFRGTRYLSLSAVARRITGTPWSGPRFFGLRIPAREAQHGAR